MERAIAVLLVATMLLSIVLAASAIIRKSSRDRREPIIADRRATFARSVQTPDSGELEQVLRGVARKRDTEIDLMVALDGVWPTLDEGQRDRIRDAAAESGLGRALTRQLESRRPVLRGTAALLIGRFQFPHAAELLAPLVDDRDGDVRLAAVRALAAVRDRSAAEVLIGTLLGGQLEHERIIERLADSWALPSILDVLRSGWGDPPARASLARALGLVGDPAAEPALRAMLQADEVEERISAARALGTAGTRSSARDLEQTLDAPEWQVRAQAARSLGLLGVESAVPALGRCLHDQAWWVRFAAAESLAELGESGRDELRRAVDGDDRYAADRAREALELHFLAGES
jgi:HEAT repeat protein